IQGELAGAEAEAARSGKSARRFADFRWTTRESWSRRRRVIGKAEWMPGRGEKGANPRFIVTSLSPAAWKAQALYERLYCARGDMEWFDRLTMRSYKRVSDGSLRRSHLCGQHAGQPAAPLVCLHG